MGNVKVTLVVWLNIIEFVGFQALIINFLLESQQGAEQLL